MHARASLEGSRASLDGNSASLGGGRTSPAPYSRRSSLHRNRTGGGGAGGGGGGGGGEAHVGGLLRVQMLMVDVVGLYAAVQEQGTDALAQVGAMAVELLDPLWLPCYHPCR